MSASRPARPLFLQTRPGRYLAALAIVAASTLLVEIIYRLFDTDRVAVVFLTGIVVTGVTLGSGPAYLAALVSLLIHNVYLVEPRFRFSAFSSEDFIVLVVFVAVALLTGRLTGRLHAAAAADRAEAETKQLLFETGAALTGCGSEAEAAEVLCGRLAALTGGEATVSIGGQVWRRGSDDGPGDGEWRRRRIDIPDGAAWEVAWRRAPDAAARLDGPAALLAELGAGAAGRLRAARRQVEAEALDRTARLRDAVLSSLSHDLRTPLASILASASSLRAFGDRIPAARRADLSATIEGEAARLSAYVHGLLDMTRLEAGAIEPDIHPCDLAEVLDRCVAPLEREGVEIRRDWPRRPLPALTDPLLYQQALANVLDNARKYAAAAGPIVVRAESRANAVVVEVEDRGPGVEEKDLELMFRKFHRGTPPPGAKGAGVGLSITRGFLEAMAGGASARLAPHGGLVVALTVPAAPGVA